MNLNDRIRQLEEEIRLLKSKVKDLSANTEEKDIKPYSVAGGNKSSPTNMPIDAKTGLTPILSGAVIWNDSEGFIPPLNVEPELPQRGYNKHSHSRYSGGALIKDKLEIVEYDWGTIVNKDSQQFWVTQPSIKKETNSKDESVEKIGSLDVVFNPDGGYDFNGNPIGTWGVATYEINVQKCYFVKRRIIDGTGGEKIGDIELDSKGQEMKSPLYNEDINKSSIVWDENGNCWRLLAVYSPGENNV